MLTDIFEPHILVAPILFLGIAIIIIVFGILVIMGVQALERENDKLKKEVLDYQRDLDIIIRGKQIEKRLFPKK